PMAIRELEQFIEDNRDHKEARLALAQHIIFEQPEKAIRLIEDFSMAYKFYDEANYIKDLVAFSQHQPDDSTVGKKISAAQLAAKNGDIEAAIQLIIEATTSDKNYAEELPRKTGVALFRTLGTQHPLTKSYRWKFDMVLY
ncbi:MAG: tetratricopeptide repeat protein, partial [Bacteroidota bacterium]